MVLAFLSVPRWRPAAATRQELRVIIQGVGVRRKKRVSGFLEHFLGSSPKANHGGVRDFFGAASRKFHNRYRKLLEIQQVLFEEAAELMEIPRELIDAHFLGTFGTETQWYTRFSAFGFLRRESGNYEK